MGNQKFIAGGGMVEFPEEMTPWNRGDLEKDNKKHKHRVGNGARVLDELWALYRYVN